MREVAIVGAGMVPFGKHRDRTLVQIGAPAVLAAMRDAGVAQGSIDAVYCGNVHGGMLVGQRVVRDLGLPGIPVVNIENACSSSATALAEAVVAVRAGRHDTVVVLGVEKLTSLGGGTLPLDHEDWEAARGMVMPALYAMRARRYVHEHGGKDDDLALVSVKARRHGSNNPYAQYRTPVTVDEVLDSRMIASPLTLLQSCPMGDGAAALVVTAGEHVHRFDQPPVWVRASVLHSGDPTTGFRDMTTPQITVRSASEAFAAAGIGPGDLDVIELHDAFSIAELVYYEALGLCERGAAVELLRSGATTYGGQVVVNPSGGLLAKGHPIGATGAAQAVEIVWQLRGEAGKRQVPGARWGLSHATGGGMSGVDHGACAVHIFEAGGGR